MHLESSPFFLIFTMNSVIAFEELRPQYGILLRLRPSTPQLLTATLKIKYNTTQICIRGLLRKNSVRIAKYWNKLPDNITNAPSTNDFKNRLIDKHWKVEDIYYLDYKSEIEM